MRRLSGAARLKERSAGSRSAPRRARGAPARWGFAAALAAGAVSGPAAPEKGPSPLPAPWTAEIRAADGARLAATVWPAAEVSDTGPRPTVLLVHGLGRDRRDWDAWGPVFQRAGVRALALDLRGHGESAPLPAALLGGDLADQARRMAADLQAAAAFLLRDRRADPAHFAAVGADFGANLAALWAASAPVKPTRIVLLSPRWEIRKADIRAAVESLAPAGPAVAVAAAGEGPGAAEARAIFEALAARRADAHAFLAPDRSSGAAFGAALLRDEVLFHKILAWILG